MRNLLMFLVCLLVACSSPPPVDPGCGGASPMADAGPVCTHCAEVIVAADNGHDPTPVIASLCDASKPVWQEIVTCGCAIGAGPGDITGTCAPADTGDCATDPWCVGLASVPPIWAHPAKQCEACLEANEGCTLKLTACWSDVAP